MRTRRILAALVTPLVIVACATGTAPIGSSGEGGPGVGGASDAGYGVEDTGASTDSGSTNKDGGITKIDSGGGGGLDSGGGGGGSGDCDNSGGGSFFYNLYCEGIGPDGPCTPGGTDCDSLGDCCFNDTSSSCYSDFGGAQCVPP